MYAFYSSTTEFYVAGDHTSSFTFGRRVKIDCGVDGIRYASVVSSAYANSSTYVTISDADVTSNITDVWLGIVQPGVAGSLPDHFHTATEGDGGLNPNSASFQAQIDSNTTSIATSTAYLQDQIDAGVLVISGTLTTVSGMIDTAITTLSGNLQNQIDTLDPLPSQTGHSGEFLTTDGSITSWVAVSGTGGSGSGPSSPYGTKWIPAGAMAPATTSGAQAGTNEYSPNYINIDYYAFDGTDIEYAEFDIVFDEEWDLGTLKAKFYWSSATGSTSGDTVEWQISAGKITDSSAIGSINEGTAQVITDTLLANNGTDLQITSATPAITVGGTPALGEIVHFKVARNVYGTDSMPVDAWLLGVLIQFHKDTVGTAW